jgi:hypothetical protein
VGPSKRPVPGWARCDRVVPLVDLGKRAAAVERERCTTAEGTSLGLSLSRSSLLWREVFVEKGSGRRGSPSTLYVLTWVLIIAAFLLICNKRSSFYSLCLYQQPLADVQYMSRIPSSDMFLSSRAASRTSVSRVIRVGHM